MESSRETPSTEPAHTATGAASAVEADAAAPAGTEVGSAGRVAARPGAAARAGADSAREAQRLSDVLRTCERSTLYHKAREGALDAMHRGLMFLVVLSGSSAAAAIANEWSAGPYLAAAGGVLGAIDLVFGFSTQARRHAVLARDFMDIAAEGCVGKLPVEELQGRCYRLAAEEPPIYEAVESLCFNQAASAVGDLRRRVVPFFPRLLRHVVRYSGRKFEVIKLKPDEEK